MVASAARGTLLKHLIFQNYVISNQPILIVIIQLDFLLQNNSEKWLFCRFHSSGIFSPSPNVYTQEISCNFGSKAAVISYENLLLTSNVCCTFNPVKI